jgi:hypothetical protein
VKRARIAAISAERDDWLRRATAAAIAAARDVVGETGLIRPSMPIGKLTISEWGWIASAAISAWVATRAEQAATEGWDLEQTIRTVSSESDIDPWDTGGVMAILPKLPEACGEGFDWSKPIGDWPKEMIAEFLLVAFKLIWRGMIARAVIEGQVAGRPVRVDVIGREDNAAAGKSMMPVAEFSATSDSDCPF